MYNIGYRFIKKKEKQYPSNTNYSQNDFSRRGIKKVDKENYLDIHVQNNQNVFFFSPKEIRKKRKSIETVLSNCATER